MGFKSYINKPSKTEELREDIGSISISEAITRRKIVLKQMKSLRKIISKDYLPIYDKALKELDPYRLKMLKGLMPESQNKITKIKKSTKIVASGLFQCGEDLLSLPYSPVTEKIIKDDFKNLSRVIGVFVFAKLDLGFIETLNEDTTGTTGTIEEINEAFGSTEIDNTAIVLGGLFGLVAFGGLGGIIGSSMLFSGIVIYIRDYYKKGDLKKAWTSLVKTAGSIKNITQKHYNKLMNPKLSYAQLELEKKIFSLYKTREKEIKPL